MQWRVGASILLVTAWLVLILLYAFIWSAPYNLFQDVVVFIASIVALIGSLGGIWASWGMRMAGMGWERWH